MFEKYHRSGARKELPTGVRRKSLPIVRTKEPLRVDRIMRRTVQAGAFAPCFDANAWKRFFGTSMLRVFPANTRKWFFAYIYIYIYIYELWIMELWKLYQIKYNDLKVLSF